MVSYKPAHPNSALRRSREEKGWSQEQLATLLETNSISIYRWESGRSLPSFYYRQKICQTFDRSAEALGLLPAVDEQEDTSSAPIYQFSVPPFGLSMEELVGRGQLVSSIKHLLLVTHAFEPIALKGLPGIGKTTLASLLARDPDVLAHFDGVLWARLGPRPQIHAALNAWGTALQLSAAELAQYKTAEMLGKVLQTRIHSRRFLLVLDDVWAIEDALAMKIGGARCSYLLTTRFPKVAHQFAFRNALVVPELTEDESAFLLDQLAPDIQKLYPEQTQLLIRQTGGLPLTLTLIGRHLHMQILSQQPRRVQQSLARLANIKDRLDLSEPLAPTERPPHLLEPTPLSLQNSLYVTIHELSSSALAMLSILAIFPAKPNYIAEDVLLSLTVTNPIDTFADLDTLLDMGLIESASPEHYMVHQSIADYVQANYDLTATRMKMIDFYVRYVGQNHNVPHNLDAELTNILAALAQAQAQNQLVAVAQGIADLGPHLRFRGMYTEAEHYLAFAHERLEELTDSTVQIAIAMEFGWALRGLGRFEDASRAFIETITLARKHQDESTLGTCLRMLGLIAITRGEYALAEEPLQEAILLARRRHDLDLLGRSLLSLSSLYSERGDNDKVEQILLEAESIGRTIQNEEILGNSLSNLGVLLYDRGEYEQAQYYVEEALTIVRAKGNLILQCYILDNLGEMHFVQGHFEQATSVIQEGLDIARRILNQERICSFLSSLADIALTHQEYHQANVYLTEGLHLAQQNSYYTLHSKLLQIKGRLFLSLQQWEEAATTLQEGVRHAEKLGSPRILGVSLCLLGDVYRTQERLELANEVYHQALEIAKTSGLRSVEAQALFGLARCALMNGDVADAEQWGKESQDIFLALDDTQVPVVREWLSRFSSHSS